MSRPELYVVNEVAVVETGPDKADVLSVPEQGSPGVPGATGATGPNLIADTTALGLLTHIADPAFLLVGNAAGDRTRKLTPTGWGLSNLLASVPAGRVPFSDAGGAVTSNAGLAFNSGTGILSAGGLTATGTVTTPTIAPPSGNLQLGSVFVITNGTSFGLSNATAVLSLSSSGGRIVWGSGAFASTGHVGLSGDTGGLLEINNGTRITLGGQPRDLTLRNLTASGNLTSTAAGSIASPSIGWDVSGGRHGWYVAAPGVPSTAYIGVIANGALHTAIRRTETTFINGVNVGWAVGADPTVGQTVGLVPDGTNTLRVTNGSTGVGNLILGNLSARGGNIDLSPASTGGVGLNGSSISSLIFNANGTNPRMGLINGSDLVLASGCRFGWGNASTVASNSSPDAELTRISAGFVGIGSPTNKVSVGHNGTGGWISTAAGYLILAPWTGQVWLGSTGAAGMRTSTEFGLAQNASMNWTNADSNFYSATIDARIRRSSANVLDVDTGTNSSFADVRLRNLTLSGRLGFATSDPAPANTTTPLLWMNVLVGGLTYKMPLYQ